MATEEFDKDFLYKASIANLRLLSGQPQQAVDVLFFHNRSFGDYTNLFETAGEMFKRGRVRFIAVTNNEGERFGSTIPFEANPGMTGCIRILIEDQQIPANYIAYPRKRAFHTREENEAFLELSVQREWKTGVILSQPHQLLRATLGMVQEMQKTGYQMEIYTISPASTPWLEIVSGSQATEKKARVDHIRDEIERVYLRQSTGELATFKQLFDYLRAREEGKLVLGPIERGSERLMDDLPPEYQAGLL